MLIALPYCIVLAMGCIAVSANSDNNPFVQRVTGVLAALMVGIATLVVFHELLINQ